MILTSPASTKCFGSLRCKKQCTIIQRPTPVNIAFAYPNDLGTTGLSETIVRHLGCIPFVFGGAGCRTTLRRDLRHGRQAAYSLKLPTRQESGVLVFEGEEGLSALGVCAKYATVVLQLCNINLIYNRLFLSNFALRFYKSLRN